MNRETMNSQAWEKLFDKYRILQRIENDGVFYISAEQIKEFREPRLMVKFDHSVNLPSPFSSNQLSILPVTRGDYAIARFDAYHSFESSTDPSVQKMSLPTYLQSLNNINISSEAIALNCASAAGIFADFMEDEEIVPTVSGRMGSGQFDFDIQDMNGTFHNIAVNNSQVEIDAAYEGIRELALIEAKNDISDDFLIRQLYYPYRIWKHQLTKPVKTIFFVYSNGIYRLYEYAFENERRYNSLSLIKQKSYSVEDTDISIADLLEVLNTVQIVPEPAIPFPQADKFERVINICELVSNKELSRTDVTNQYAFDRRQTNYYTDAARYLGLIEKQYDKRTPIYSISEEGKKILQMQFKQRQLAFCACILSHRVFNESLKLYFKKGTMPSADELLALMKNASLYKVDSESTFERRSSSIRGWLQWIVSLITI